MIETFYYIGLFCLLSCIEEVVSIKRLKRMNDFSNETISDGSNKLDEIQEKVSIGEQIDLSKELKSTGDIYKKAVKKTTPLRIIIGLITMFWNIIGIFITEQKMFFIVLLLITFFSPYLIRAITKDERQQLILSYITNIVSLLFVSVISYNHFFKFIN